MLVNTTLSVNFSWTFAHLEYENATICHQILFSVRSHQSSVPYDFEDNMEPPGDSGNFVSVNQQTYYIFNNISRFTYYQFELRIQSPPISSKYQSYVYYFGDQVPARVTDPASGHSVIQVHEGDSVTIPCNGTGTPTPSVLLLTSELQQCEGCPPVNINNFIAAVSEQDTGEYFCVAANTLVSRGQ